MASEIDCKRHPNEMFALGSAVNLVAAHRPFSEWKAWDLIATLRGCIARGHYLFAIENDEVKGFIGWGLCDEGVAADYVKGLRTPRHEDCLSGDNAVIFVAYAEAPRHLRALSRGWRQACPGHPAIGRRLYRDGRARLARFRPRPAHS
jgi:hemolysin-activating ACP:hemolysin acyltransferase